MTSEEVQRLAAMIADKAQDMRLYGHTERDVVEQAAIDGLLCGSSPEFRAVWLADA